MFIARYDPTIIQQQANRLYVEAAAQVARYAVGYGLLGIPLGVMLGTLAHALGFYAEHQYVELTQIPHFFGLSPIFGFFGGGICAFLGGLRGHGKGSLLRLQAQMALCQLQIERGISALVQAAAAQPAPGLGPHVGPLPGTGGPVAPDARPTAGAHGSAVPSAPATHPGTLPPGYR